MPNYTRKAILDEFEKMLLEMPFNKITVTALVARTEISSNTFYYHFRDIYGLLDSFLEVQLNKVLYKTGDIQDWRELLRNYFYLLQDNPKIVYHLTDFLSKNTIEKYVFVSVKGQLMDYTLSRFREEGMDSPFLVGLAEMYSYSLLGLLVEFVWNRMEADVDEMIDSISPLYSKITELLIQDQTKPE